MPQRRRSWWRRERRLRARGKPDERDQASARCSQAFGRRFQLYELLVSAVAAYRCTGAGNFGRGLHEHFAPASRRILGIFDSGDGGCLRRHGMGKGGREARSILKQALQWGAILVAMNIMLLAGVQQFMPAPATGLVLLMLLALGAFLAGLNLSSLQICFWVSRWLSPSPRSPGLSNSRFFCCWAPCFWLGLA
jgi:hypothetical protein